MREEKVDNIKRLKHELQQLDIKKKRYKKKLEEITIQSETQDMDLEVLRKQVKREVNDLNKLNFDIDKARLNIELEEEMQKRNKELDK